MRKRELIERLSVVEGQLGQVIPNYILATERLAELELDLEDIGWERLTGGKGREFSREAIQSIGNKALLYYAKNPIINHGIEVQGHYVFGQGVTITGESEEVDKLWRLFWDDPKNRAELTTPSALFLKEIDLQIEGNIFLSLFTSAVTGAVRVRSIHSNEIVDIITNPDDSKEPWFYHRAWAEQRMTDGVWSDTKERDEYYPAWNYRPKGRPPTLYQKPVNWDSPIYHIKAGGTSSMRFGVPEVYSALDWAKAAKEAMEDYATVRSAHARFADSLVTKGGPAGVAAAKAKLGTTFGEEGTGEETVPSPVTGSTFIGAEGWKLDVFRTSGAQAPPEEARYLFVMAGAGMGLSYSILMGDADKSNLATAKTLDRPIELRMQMRRMLWTTIFGDLNTYLLMAAARATKPAIKPKPKLIADEWGTERVVIPGTTPEGDPIPTGIVVSWPSILEHDVVEAVKALVNAFTREGKADAGLFPEQVQVRELATALGIEDVDTIIDEMIAAAEEVPPAEETAQETEFVEALKMLKEALKGAE